MIADLWPPFAITLTTPRVVLRLPTEAEIAALARLAAEGVHGPDERPFLTPWTEGPPESRARHVLQGHWARLASWRPEDWSLGLGVFTPEGEPMGGVTLGATDFRVRREVSTSSWLGLRFQGQGFGTHARAALLALAFDHLGATDATTEVFQDNDRSQGVSRRLGYLPDGISRDVRGEEVLVSDRLRLTVDRWRRLESRVEVQVSGIEAAAHLFV